ncbi:helicase-exonuclease AddAB subunit AddB [Lysinibacillus louembei]|uniref:Helicase-exonuclease AddAB subunit AddB n=1 Tax=Lysinibacillus louembei TaxID=1470088 RepID=A0ABZ0RW31_9BACI|nr:helicase-exonuclease AddAB subunit AddB [Lysinibacillus louembei]WPK12360.1 helicase-exonuclease AddAB subunit AddB [Lysinibacillus louembei]
MALRIISGRAGTGKTTMLQQEVVQYLKEDPLGPPLFIIVPDQISFKTEYDLTNRYDVRGMIRAQALTFKRLAWFILQETGGIARDKIDSFGYRMLIRRILQDNKEQFSIFTQAAGKRGFTQEIEQLLREFSQYDITSTSIIELIKELETYGAANTLVAKMKDFQIILQQLEENIGEGYVDGEGFYPILVEQLQNSEKIKHSEIYIDGFTSFTIREFAIIEQLLLLAKRVTIVLPFDSEYDAADPQALFHRAAFTYDKLMDFAMQHQIDVEDRIHLTTNYRTQQSDLAHIEENFHESVPTAQTASGAVQIIEGTNRRAEVQGIAREIIRLVTEEQMRYKDIGIMYRQADIYDPLIATIFQQHDIPFFMNEKRPMLHHPFIEFMRSSLEAVISNWQYEPVFRAVKTDLFLPLADEAKNYREQLDKLENFVIAKGIIGKRWHDNDVWQYRRFRVLEKMGAVQTDKELEIQRMLEEARQIVREPLLQLEQTLKKAKTGLEIGRALYDYAEHLQLYDKLQKMKEQELETASELANEHDQVWNGWVNILDQFVLMFGEQEVTLQQAAEMLDEGYDSLRFSSIPPTIDVVTIATVEYSRFNNIKAVFIVGVNDGVYPMRIDKEGLLSDADRTYFDKLDYELAPNAKNRLLQEAFLIYQAFASPTDKLYITFASVDEEGKSLLPSLYITRLHKLFTVQNKRTLPHIRIFIDPVEELDQHKILSYLRHPKPAIAYLATQLKETEQTKLLAAEWRALRAFYRRYPEWERMLQFVTRPLYTINKAEPLQPTITERLYGEELQASVSRIEKFYRCPYSHFATYGLRLEERAEYRLETFAMGDLFHEALRTILTNGDMPPENYRQCLQRAREVVEPLVHIFSYRILESNSRYLYIKEKLIRVVARTLFALTEHAKVAKFKPLVHEKPFGKVDDKTMKKGIKPLPALEIPLENKRKMYLRGQIDRIDAYEENGQLHLRVVDYKSSSRDLDLNEVYHGISLQLLTYLDVAVKNAKELLALPEHQNIAVTPAGVLYVHVHDPLIRLEEYVDEQMRELQRLEKYRMQGLLTNEIPVLEAMDGNLLEQKKSPVIPVSMTTKGAIGAYSKTVDVETMPVLQDFVIEKHREAGNKIFTGVTDIYPYKLKNRTACDYCAFKAICQFDPSDGHQQYHNLSVKKTDDLIARVRKECGYSDITDTEETD